MNKTLLIGLILVQLLITFKETNALQRVISIKKFGAVGDGKKDDHQAFVDAANFINNAKQDIKLIIPYGTYIVGRQNKSTKYYLEGEPVLKLDNVKNISIIGVKKNGKRPIIKFRNNIYFGTFYTEGPNIGKAKCTPKNNTYDTKSAATAGSCFQISNSNNVSISDLEINGNQANMKIGGYYGDKGRQLDHRGLYLITSRNLFLNNLFIHHFGLDGIELTISSNTTILNSRIEYNGRQALSWVAGDSLIMKRCQLNYSGCSRINSSPGAGLDIECEGSSRIQYGRFSDCEFKYNKGCGVISDRNKLVADNMKFERCLIVGYYSWALWIMASNTTFNKCNIYGQCAHTIHANDVQNVNEITTFSECNFNNVYKNQFTFKQTPFMFELNNERVRFLNCKVITQNIGMLYHGGQCNANTPPSEIRDCTFICDNTANSQIATECISVYNSSFSWVEKVSTNFNMIQNQNNKFVKLPRTEIQKLIKSEEKGTRPFEDLINSDKCIE